MWAQDPPDAIISRERNRTQIHATGGHSPNRSKNIPAIIPRVRIVAHPPSELEVANRLYRPSYVSFTFALSYYHIIPETVYAITCATTRTSATFDALGKQFVYRRLKRAAFTGYRTEQGAGGRGGVTPPMLIAEPEKALVDTLYFVALKKQGLPERVDIARLSKPKISAFAKLFAHPALDRLVEDLTRTNRNQN